MGNFFWPKCLSMADMSRIKIAQIPQECPFETSDTRTRMVRTANSQEISPVVEMTCFYLVKFPNAS